MQFAQTISERFRQWRSKLATGGVAVFAMYVAFHVVFGANGMVVYQHKKAEQQRLQQEVLRMQEENKQLQQDIQNLKSDPKTIEKEAREQLKYARPGEVIYVMSAPKVAEQLPDAAENKLPK